MSSENPMAKEELPIIKSNLLYTLDIKYKHPCYIAFKVIFKPLSFQL